MIGRVWTGCAVAAVLIGVLAAPERGVAAAPLCAFHESTTVSGTVATSTFHVVQNGCMVSLVSIFHLADSDGIFDTATGVFAASETRYTLTVDMPCNRASETDLVLGPPSLYPPAEFDLQATPFNIVCPTGGGGSSSGGGSSGGDSTSGGGSSGGGSSGGGTSSGVGAIDSDLPDLISTVTSSKANGVRMGDTVSVNVTVTNKGKGAASGARVLITPSLNLIVKGEAVASSGPGCFGVGVIDCNLGSLSPGMTTTVRLRLSAVRGKTLVVSAIAQRAQRDASPGDDLGILRIKLIPRSVRFTVAATAARIAAGEQYAFVKLSSRGTVTAQVYVGGVAQRIVWRRRLIAGTSPVRIPIPKLDKGQRFTIVLRATNDKRKANAILRLKA